MTESTALKAWTKATGSMRWGVQSAFKDALSLVEEGKTKMVHSANVHDGSPCLVNSISAMIHKNETPGKAMSPSDFAGQVVSAFDAVNMELCAKVPGSTDPHYVTPFAAEILLGHFGAMVPKPVDKPKDEKAEIMDAPYVEKSDEELAMEFLHAATTEAPCPEPTVINEAEVLSDENIALFLNQ